MTASALPRPAVPSAIERVEEVEETSKQHQRLQRELRCSQVMTIRLSCYLRHGASMFDATDEAQARPGLVEGDARRFHGVFDVQRTVRANGLRPQ